MSKKEFYATLSEVGEGEILPVVFFLLPALTGKRGVHNKYSVQEMSLLKNLISRVNRQLNVLTDWLLIGVGCLLVFKALIAVDLTIARYVITGLGVLFIGFGLCYRHRRIRRSR